MPPSCSYSGRGNGQFGAPSGHSFWERYSKTLIESSALYPSLYRHLTRVGFLLRRVSSVARRPDFNSSAMYVLQAFWYFCLSRGALLTLNFFVSNSKAVNTAARMEQTGQVGRIQASQQTANELMSTGKADWIKPREDKINPKGKGLQQTFWVEPSVDMQAHDNERCKSHSCHSFVAPDRLSPATRIPSIPPLMPFSRQRSTDSGPQRRDSF